MNSKQQEKGSEQEAVSALMKGEQEDVLEQGLAIAGLLL